MNPPKKSEPENSKLKCEVCGALHGDLMDAESGMRIEVREFLGQKLCDRCEDAYCTGTEHVPDENRS